MPQLRFFIFSIMVVLVWSTPAFSGQNSILTTQKIIVLDPGHGGQDTGIIAAPELFEKDITLRLAKKTAAALEKKYNVVLTRPSDTRIDLKGRITLANTANADLFVSLHLAGGNKKTYFFHYLSAPDLQTGIRQDKNDWHTQHLDHTSDSKAAADIFMSTFSKALGKKTFISISSPTATLEGARMPAVLIEPLGPSEILDKTLLLDNILDRYAILISKSIDAFISKKS